MKVQILGLKMYLQYVHKKMAKSLQAKQAHDKTGHCNGASTSSLGIVPIRKIDKTSHAVAKLATSNTDQDQV